MFRNAIVKRIFTSFGRLTGRRYVAAGLKRSWNRPSLVDTRIPSAGARRRTLATLSNDPSVKLGDSALEVYLASSKAAVSLPYVWLRDSCPCPLCVHPSTRQKLHRTTDVPLNIGPKRASWNSGILEVEWNRGLYQHDTASEGVEGHPSPVASQPHVSRYSQDFLGLISSPNVLDEFHSTSDTKATPWLRAELLREPSLFIPYRQLISSKAILAESLQHLVQRGIMIVTDVPNLIPKSDEGWELAKVADRLSHVRETFYGKLWDVKSLPMSETRNVAYTDLDLDVHMDLLYFESPPRFQLLHCLRNRNVSGGQSLYVDALQAAQTLRKEDPEAFHLLATTDVAFWYVNDGHHLERKHKTIVVDPTTQQVTAVNYSPPFQAPLPFNTPKEFYPAFQKFAALLRRPEARYEYMLKEGDLVVFDNRRVLHARRAFAEHGGKKDGGPNRWLKGCYVEADAVLDRLRTLKKQLREQS